MSSTRNKRKRSENEGGTVAPPSRRRSREQRAASTSPVPDEKKNEEDDNNNAENGSTDANANASSNLPQQGKQNSEARNKQDGETEKSMKNAHSPEMDKAMSEDKKSDTENQVDSSEDTGSTSQGTETKRKALHSSESLDETAQNESSIDDSDRASRIRGLISHRSILLERIRLCRTVAEKRLLNGADTKDDGPRKDLTDEEEIAKFRELSMQANQAAKKARSDSDVGAVEKRTSLSLRRGSSVGKRMNAALSSLAPGSHPEIASAQVSQALSLQAAKAISKAQQGSSSLPSKKPVSVTSSIQSIKGTQYSTAQTAKVIKSSSSQAFPGKQSGSEPSQRSRQSSSKNSKGPNNANRQSSATRPDPLAMPQHFGASMSGLPQNRLAVPPVHYPEAMALREKRNSIQIRLKALLEKKLSNDLGSGKRTGSAQIILQPGQPPALPQRRKTHWDVLLQEMSWMASDFIEERKWKVSAARTIASSIPNPSLSVSSSHASLTGKGSRDKKDESVMDVDEKDSAEETKETPVEVKRPAKSKRTKRKPKPIILREYPSPTMENIKSCQNVGRVLSVMISELGNAAIDAGAMGQTDEYHLDALARFRKARSEILNQPSEDLDLGSTENERMPSSDVIEEDKSHLTKNDFENDSRNKLDESIEELSFEGISEHIDNLQSPNERRTKSSTTDIMNALGAGKLNLTSFQKETFDFVERAWTSTPSRSAIIAGQPLSGKTISTCCILWKQRSKGPQILICSQTSLFRWKHEISRFSKMRVLTFGLSGGISIPDSADEMCIEPVAGDVVLCEFSSVQRLLEKKTTAFHSMVIDCRHTSSFFASLGKTTESDLATGNHINDKWNGPIELISTVWWNQIMKILLSSNPRLMLIEYYDPDTFSLSRSGLGDKQQLEILACRAACVCGPHLFRSAHSSIERRVISWARKKGKSQVSDKVARVRKILDSTVGPIYFQIPGSSAPKSAPWELRRCDMAAKQRLKYDNCCLEVRGALSTGILHSATSSQPALQSFHAVSRALFRLREYCFHSDSDGSTQGGNFWRRMVKSFSPQGQDNECQVPYQVIGSSAQPNIALALELVRASAKLQELVSILKFECRYNLHDEDILGPLLNARTNSRSPIGSKDDGKRRKKIVILAVLPQVQITVSILLNALGIRHDILQNPMFRRMDETSAGRNRDSNRRKETALAWLHHQMVLARFKEVRGGEASSDVIVASPTSLVGWNQGLGIEDADIVVSLDEDWTGRGEFILGSLIARTQVRKSFTKSRLQLIRLICAGTVEDKIFSDCGKLKENVVARESIWPCDNSGFLVFPDSENGAISLYEQKAASLSNQADHFPAMKMMKLRDKLLADVLLTSLALPPVFKSGSQVRFLPSNGVKVGKARTEIAFVRALLELEVAASLSQGPFFSTSESFLVTEKRDHHISFPRMFPNEVMTRQDSRSLMVLCYFEKQCKLPVWAQSESSSAAIALAQLPNTSLNCRLSGPLVAADSAIPDDSDNSDFADSWRKSGLTCKPDDLASSLLFYQTGKKKFSADTSEAAEKDATVENDEEQTLKDSVLQLTNSKRRFNAYAKLFSSSWDGNSIRDGNQGSEPLVYFPPLFHGMLEFHSNPRNVSEARVLKELVPTMNKGKESTFVDSSALKRKEGPQLETLSAKRMRFPENQLDKNGSIAPDAAKSSTAGDTSTEADPTKVLESSVVRPSEQVGDNSLAESIDMIGVSQISETGNLLEGSPSMFDEDYGLLGAGDIPLSAASAIMASRTTSGVGDSFPSFSTGKSDDFMSNLFPCDLEESESAMVTGDVGLNSILLFVKKPPRALQGYRPTTGHATGLEGAHPLPVPLSLQGVASALKPMNGEDSAKKSKKKFSTNSLNARPLSASSAMHLAGKDTHRHRLHASYAARQFGTGLSMFESASFRVASLQVERRVVKRMEELGWNSTLSYEAGPGLPLQRSEESKITNATSESDFGWTKLTKPLDANSTMDDSAMLLSSQQRAALRRSFVAPCRVDFGPGCGYLASTSGMTGITPLRSRLGVSLPMGVKVPQSIREQPEPLWTTETDSLLQDSVLRFGMNWMLVARAVNGFEGIVNGNITEVRSRVRSSPKSARQCRDQWQLLARNKATLTSDFRKSERNFRERATLRSEKIPDADAVNISNASFCKQSVVLPQHLTHHQLEPLVNKPGAGSDNSNAVCNEDKVQDVTAVAPMILSEGGKEAPVEKPKIQGRFAALLASRPKRHYIPINIPGVVSGSQQNQPVASHNSHMQSVQASVASQWSSGRTEMWPLQILELADKQRSGSRTPSDTSTQPGGAARRQPSKSSSHHRSTTSSKTSASRAAFPAAPSNSSRKSSKSPVPGKAANRPPTSTAQSRPSGSAPPSAKMPPAKSPPTNMPPAKIPPKRPPGNTPVPAARLVPASTPPVIAPAKTPPARLPAKTPTHKASAASKRSSPPTTAEAYIPPNSTVPNKKQPKSEEKTKAK